MSRFYKCPICVTEIPPVQVDMSVVRSIILFWVPVILFSSFNNIPFLNLAWLGL